MIIRLKGGLGNQMFIYALARKLQHDYGVEDLKFDTSFFEYADDLGGVYSIDEFNVKYTIASKAEIDEICLFKHYQKPRTFVYRLLIFLETNLNKRYYRIKNFRYVPPEELLKYAYIDGSWQAWKYLEGIEHILRREFSMKHNVSSTLQRQIDSAKNENAVFVGIRKGDYTDISNVRMYGILTNDYYNRAINYITERIPNSTFYIISDDIEWVKKNMHFPCKVTFRDNKMVGTAQEEMMFMKSCKHAIIANSTFHWWGAWLIENPDKIVIAPTEWFADGTEIDILPPYWVLINRNQ